MGSETHRLSYSMGTVVREVNDSPQSNAKLKNGWSCSSSPLMCLYGMDGENIAFTFTPPTKAEQECNA
jgi:hypothetical protein